MAFDYPVFLDLTGVRVLVVGGGTVAARKIDGLVAAGAEVTVVATTAVAAVRRGEVRLHLRGFHPDDLATAQLVVVATDDPAVNAAVAADCRAAGVWVNAADDPANCTFILPAITRRDPLTVAVSSGGATPAVAQYVRDRIAAEVLTPELAVVAAEMAEERAVMRARGESSEGHEWRQAILERMNQFPDA
jgi:siroheme synthase-like protein